MNESGTSVPYSEPLAHAGGGPARWRRLLLIGPAIVIGALQFGPGNTVSAATVGANHGYSAIWLVAASTVLMLVYTDMGVRVGLASDTSSVQSIKDALSRPVGMVLGAAVFIIACLFVTGSLIGASLGLESLFGANVKVWTVVCSVVMIGLLLIRRAYKPIERLMIAAVATMVVVFAATAIMSQPDWLEVAGGFVPGPIAGGNVEIFALLGTNLSIYAAFYVTYTIREKGTSRHDYRGTTYVDTLPGVIIPGIMTIFIIVAGAQVISGQSIENADDIAAALEPTVGVAASAIFAIGIFAAGFSSVVGNVAAGGTAFADGLGRGASINNRLVKILGAAVLLVGLLAIVMFGGAPVQLLLLANALTLFVFPVLAVTILFLANSRARMGALRNTWWQNALAGAALVLIIIAAVQLAIELPNSF